MKEEPETPFSGTKRPRSEADHSFRSGAIYLHSPIRLHGVLLNEAQGKFYVYLALAGLKKYLYSFAL
jgi:hypothetical protein